jgi:hypothetical protein
MDRKTLDQLIRAREHWNLCLHEAAHAVVHIRQGGEVKRVKVYENARANSSTLGIMMHSDFGVPAVYVAGHFAELRWGVGHVFRIGDWLSGSSGDLENVTRMERWIRGDNRITKSDRKSARETWQKQTRRLHALANRDSSFERQVKAVAKALSFRGTLTGPEVLAILRAV